MQQIAYRVVERSRNDSGYCVAAPESKIGEPFKKRINKYGYITLTSYSHASLWDGKKLYFSKYY